MSPVPICLPDLGTDHAQLSLWLVSPGEHVYEGDRVVEVIIPGTVIDVSAPVTGRLLERIQFANDRLTTGQVLGTIEPDPDA